MLVIFDGIKYTFNMSKPKFYLDSYVGSTGDQAINMFYSFSSQRLQYYTGISTNKKFFRPECNKSTTIKPIRSIAPNAVAYNERLSDLAISAVSIVSSAKNKDFTKTDLAFALDEIYKPTAVVRKLKVENPIGLPKHPENFISFFSELIDDTKSGKRILKKGKNRGGRYSVSAIKNYSKTLKSIERYLRHEGKKSLTFSCIDKSFYDSYRSFCFDVENREVSTFSNHIKDIKTIMSEAPGVNFNPQDFVCPEYESDDIALSPEQLEALAQFDFSDQTKYIELTIGKQTTRLSYDACERLRDEFLIGCYSGLRFSDLNNLAVEKVENDFIRVQQIKTGQRVTIPIMSKLRPYLTKYSDRLPNTPYIKFLYGIREIARLAGLTKLIQVRNTKGNKVNVELMPLWKQIGSHTCRRSYATNMFKAGIPILLIRSVTGHTTEESFLRYIKANNEDKAKLLAEQYLKFNL